MILAACDSEMYTCLCFSVRHGATEYRTGGRRIPLLLMDRWLQLVTATRPNQPGAGQSVRPPFALWGLKHPRAVLKNPSERLLVPWCPGLFMQMRSGAEKIANLAQTVGSPPGGRLVINEGERGLSWVTNTAQAQEMNRPGLGL